MQKVQRLRDIENGISVSSVDDGFFVSYYCDDNVHRYMACNNHTTKSVHSLNYSFFVHFQAFYFSLKKSEN